MFLDSAQRLSVGSARKFVGEARVDQEERGGGGDAREGGEECEDEGECHVQRFTNLSPGMLSLTLRRRFSTPVKKRH